MSHEHVSVADFRKAHPDIPPEVVGAIHDHYKGNPAIIAMILGLIQSLLGGGGNLQGIIAAIFALFNIPLPTPTPTPPTPTVP